VRLFYITADSSIFLRACAPIKKVFTFFLFLFSSVVWIFLDKRASYINAYKFIGLDMISSSL
jgi:hypothetical protein